MGVGLGAAGVEHPDKKTVSKMAKENAILKVARMCDSQFRMRGFDSRKVKHSNQSNDQVSNSV